MNEILTQLQSTISTALTGRGITTFFIGKQDVPAKSDLPIVMIYGTETRQSHSGTVRDQAEYDITVEIRADVRQSFNSETGTGTQLKAYEALIDMMEQRESDGDLQTNTVMGIVNANLSIGGRTLYTDNLVAQYDPYLEAGEFPTVQAVLTFTAYDRPNRT